MGQYCSSVGDGQETAHLSVDKMVDENQKKVLEIKRQKDEQQRRQHELEEARKRKIAETEVKERANAQAAEDKRKQEEARRIQDQRARDAKLADQRARHEQDEQQRREKESKKVMVNDYIKSLGFEQGINGINEVKKYKRHILNHQHTPLHAAVQENNSDMVKLLLEMGADRKILADRKTPKQLAVKLNKKDSHAEIIALLEKTG